MPKHRMVTNYEQFSSLLDIPDMDMLIAMAIGSRHILHTEIAEAYKEKKDEYYELFRNSPYYRDKRLASLSVQNYRAIQQSIGIYLYEKAKHTNELTMKFIKKGYRFVFNFINNHLKVDIYKLRDDYIQYVKKHSFDKNIHSAHLFGIALYLCRQLKKDIIYDDFDVKLINDAIGQVFIDIETKPDLDIHVEPYLEPYKSIGVMKKDFQLPLKDLLVSMNSIHKQQAADEKDMDSHEDIEEFIEQTVDNDFFKGLSKITIMLQYCNINPLDLQNITNIDYSKMRELIILCLTSKELLGLKEDINSLLGSYLLIYALANDYNFTKHNLIVTSQEEVHYEILRLKRAYESKIQILQQQEESNTAHFNRLKETNHQLQNTVQKLEKKITKGEKRIQELEEEIQLIKREKELALQIPIQENVEELSEEEMARFLNEKKCIIVGGIKSWQDHLKTYIPSGRFIQPEELNIDLDFVSNADLVLFNETVNNHSMFQKIKSQLENTNIPMVYSGTNTNIKISLKKMYDQLV